MSSEVKQIGKQLQESGYRIYSLGYAATNKDSDNDIFGKELEIHPIEVKKFSNGELTDNAETIEVDGKTGSGQSYSAKVNVTGSMKATWRSIGGANRITAPNVRRGEMVVVYQSSDNQKVFFWDTLGNDISLRRQETMIYAVAAEGTLDKPASIQNDNCYFFQMSSHSKNIIFSTSKSNGEEYRYVFQIDAKNNNVLVTDDDENYFTIASKNRLIEMRNGDGSFFRLNGKRIEMYAEDGIHGITEAEIDLKAQGDVSIHSESSSTFSSVGNTTVAAQGGAVMDAPTIGFAGSVSSTDGSFGGDGSMELKGRATFKEDVQMNKNLNVNGDIKSGGTITCINLSVTNKPW